MSGRRGRAADGGAGRRTAGGGRGAVKVRTPHKDVGKKIDALVVGTHGVATASYHK